MDQAVKIGLKNPRPKTIPENRQPEAVLAADYRLSPVAQVVLDRNGCIRRCNLAAAILLKGETSQLIGIPFVAFVDKVDCRLFLDHVSQATSRPQRIVSRLVLSRTTRAVGPIELQTTSSVDPLTGLTFCRTAIVQASFEKPLTDGLRSRQYGYQGWFDLFADAAFLGIGDRIISANPSALKLLGARKADEIEGHEIMEIIHPESYRSFKKRTARLPEGKAEATGAEEKLVRLDGQEIVVDVVLKSVDFGGVFATLVVARDGSKEREMEENLVRAKALSSQILANNSIATAVLSCETGRFTETNEIFCRLVGRPPESIIGQPLSAIQLTGEGDAGFLNLTSQTDSREYEVNLVRPDGSALNVLVTAKPTLAGDERSILLMIQDLTDLRRLRKDIVAISEEEQRRFSRDLHDSHCQDLTAIAFFAETIAAGLASHDKEAAKQIRMLVDMVQRSAENVHALAAGLDSQQIQEAGLTIALEKLVSRVGRRFGLTCTAAIDRNLEDRTAAQALHLYRIAQEAMSNAARHGRPHFIKLEFQLDVDTGTLRITDDGVGFTREKTPNGLGLRTMEYRASLIRGSLKIESKPGSGTVVTCSFPLPGER
ncbi:MAG: PAS domain S-box protein [Verrucomicrobia bacterium]|nr:PAS domain S-box protein [Verrucomicrobiota bacterium]